ncbi:DUF5518 domain-containing protein [Halorussus amylolyticus]|uniref:DUF5518 domain-containing protein n=1 Tax=Halorussus amylolyticus TaxID=1126242 RepID=UPI00138EFB52|nr:DUF5518 domain-containing protein [Halorussus amylolyticus]
MDVLLGLASIPFTVVLTSDPSLLEMSPVLVAGFASGLYYGSQSKSVRRAGFRTGAVGSIPVLWTSVDFVSSEILASLDSLAFVVAVGTLWFVFAMIVNALGAALCAMAGGWVSRTVSGSA